MNVANALDERGYRFSPYNPVYKSLTSPRLEFSLVKP